MVIVANTHIVFKYLNLLPFGARGGVTRFFMLTQDIPFEEKLLSMSEEWPMEKKRLIASGENPSGSVPVISNEGNPQHQHSQHIAVSRYLARVYRVTSGDDYKDYVQDLVADEYQGFRDEWVKVTFSGSDEEKAAYKEGNLIKQLTKFNALYETFKTDDTFLSVSAKTGNPLWGDAAVYGLLRDHILSKYISLEDLTPYPKLSAMYLEYEKIPAVQKWLEGLGN